MTVCRGCCCGTDKHPDVDHVGQLRQLLDGLGPHARLRTTGCLDSCDYSNTVVVQPSALGRRLGGRPSWLKHVLTPDLTEAVIGWVVAGGPGVAEPPAILLEHQLLPGRQRRTSAGG
ncbi:MAG TPA: (2Fe-2S) ferredoxin domain-containing protein [Jiangellales bacterium]|nr:(2Fe-2S) ferredoxin domain-containing protein [Jiangellales bacterium]